ncbi:hypothetical protein LSP04_21920 [Levilactobacillus spicheri]|uniref:Uncharacterized protein n=1 Tax=Levilactobacillus spicheri TaxID=216463 RepID=A0ABQ0WRV1_9LACO|nr:hypothetical protein LSP04_21920 [Levilactobacillus spicheri]
MQIMRCVLAGQSIQRRLATGRGPPNQNHQAPPHRHGAFPGRLTTRFKRRSFNDGSLPKSCV